MSQRQSIQALPEHIVSRIAAGEVVERPAGALKELIENAIDAGATKIDVHIKNGGKSLLKIIDNGHGIPKNELDLALSRHATSKLMGNDKGEFDLSDIQHLGFRGEALAAISSVSILTIESFYENQEHGYAITSHAGLVEAVKPCALMQGTTITIKDLFYAVPARLGFLKSDRSEQIAISDVIKRQALMNPHIGFTLHDEVRKVLNYLPSQSDLFQARFERIGDVISKEFIENSMAIDLKKDRIHIEGLASLPTYHRGNGLQQFLYVNGRAVRDKMLSGVLRAAYNEHLARDRHPICVLFISVPSSDIDVNVHPTKAEVRFKDDYLVRSTIITAIRTAISEIGHKASNHTTQMTLNTIDKQTVQSLPLSQKPQFHIQEQIQLNIPKPSPLSPLRRTEYVNVPSSYKDLSYQAQQVPDFQTALSSDVLVDESLEVIQEFPKDTHITQKQEPQPDDYPLGYAQAQLHLTYIVSQTNNGIIIVDQHAAHERIILEKIKTAMKQGGVTPQPLLIPEILDVSDKEMLALNEKEDDLKKLGLVIESFGHQQILIRSIPAFFTGGNVKGLIKDLCDDLCDNREADSLIERINLICATFACHHSVRAGRKLSIPEMNALLREMENTSGSGQCNHGRPTYITLEKKDIERLFGRK